MFETFKLKREKQLFEIQQYRKAREMMESLPTFARDEDEDDWRALSSDKEVYSEQEITDMQESARSLYYKNPIAGGIVETIINFSVGKECQVTSLDENPEVQQYWDRFYKANKFDEKSKEIARRMIRDGEMFLRFFEPKESDGVQSIRFVEPSEITDHTGVNSHGIEVDPDDVEKVVNYHRAFKRNEKSAVTEYEVIPADEIIHRKIRVDSNVKRGVSFFVGIGAYIKKYQNWLEDRITLNKIRTMFNLIGKPTGITPTEMASKFADVTGKTPTGGTAKKKLPKSGSVLFSKGIEWEFKNLNINASDTKDDGRAILLMIVAGTNFAEYMVTGDASNANFSSTMVSESPAVKAFEGWQDTFEKVFQAIHRKVIAYGIESGSIPAMSKKTLRTFDKTTGEEKEEKQDVETSVECQVEFPILIHRDIKEETEALQIQRLNGWVSDRTASGRLGYNYREEQEQIEIENIKQKQREGE